METTSPAEAGRRAHEPGGIDDLLADIARLTDATRGARDVEVDRQLLRLRHLAGIERMSSPAALSDHPTPDFDRLPEPVAGELPSFVAADVSAGLLRAAILRDGCMLVRGFIDPGAAEAFALEIERAFAERERADAGEVPAPGYYELFQCSHPYPAPPRKWIKSGGALLAADSPRLVFDLMEMYDAAGVPRIVADYLGGPPVVSVQKTSLRKVEPTAYGAWHQDGSFMGPTRSLNLWVSLTHSGIDAPGLDVVPRRLHELAPVGTEGTLVPHEVAHALAEQSAGALGIVRPTFAPGDVVFFDDLFLHRTATAPGMVRPRYAIESWFFAGSEFPSNHAPIAVSAPPPR